MSVEKDSIIFIPNISGFTEFVNKTEINHSQHIISELLEVLVDSNELEMEISEVEGDAIIFYKYQHMPSPNQLIRQTRKMFIRFHEHLKLYDSRRICQCGACSTATNLTLKFIVHAGPLGFTTVKNQKKPFGAALVLAHKLLKNEVTDNEYMLCTPSAFDGADVQSARKDLWASFRELKSTYEEFGEVPYYVLPLAKLHAEISDPTPIEMPEKMPNPVTGELRVQKPLLDTYELLSNFELKILWQKDIREFNFEKGRVNRVGTRHICVFESGQAEFQSVTNDFGKDKVVYGERLLSFPLAKNLTFYFILEPDGEGTRIHTEIHYEKLPLIGWLFEPLVRRNLKKITQKFISSFPKD